MRKVGKFHILKVWVIVLFSLVVAQDDGKAKIKTELVNVDVMVKDADGKRVPDLKKEDFEIYEDGVLQEIADFKPAPHPMRLILIFDTSVSMGAIFPAVKDEAVKMVDSLNQLDEIMIGSFDAGLQWSSEWGGKALATNEILALKSTSNYQPTSPGPQPTPPRPRPRFPSPFPIPPGGRAGAPDKNTNLFGAMSALFDRVGSRSGNEIVLLFSDGKDSVDRDLAKQRPVKDSKQVVRAAQGSRSQIYAACFKPEREGSSNPLGGFGRGGYGSDCKFLSDIADAAGGRSFEFESQSALTQVLKKTLDELRSQYTLAYYPSSQGNRAGFHKIKIVVKKQDMIARAREGYLVSK